MLCSGMVWILIEQFVFIYYRRLAMMTFSVAFHWIIIRVWLYNDDDDDANFNVCSKAGG